jgi:GNAT superfamily N-acetyltransferase
MPVTIRIFEDRDYDAVAEVGNSIFPEYPATAEEMRFHDRHRQSDCPFQRWVAESDEGVLASGSYEQFPWMNHPGRFYIGIQVRPERQRRGIGSRIYERILEELAPLEPCSLRAMVREDMIRGLEFLRRRGFQEERRQWESRLDVNAFDFSPYAELEEKVEKQGVEIRTLRELSEDPERDRKLFELCCEVWPDMPTPEPFTRPDFATWLKSLRENPNLLPDGYFIAVRGGEYIAISNLWASQADDSLYTGDTGVLRVYRRRGVAIALKVRAVRYARDCGKPLIRTWNDTRNRAMLCINERLGFVKQPVWIHLVKNLDPRRDLDPGTNPRRDLDRRENRRGNPDARNR